MKTLLLIVALFTFSTSPESVVKGDYEKGELNFGYVIVGNMRVGRAFLANIGNAVLHLKSISIVGANVGDGKGFSFYGKHGCHPELAPLEGCSIEIQFAPDNYGMATGEIMITDDSSGSLKILLLTGIGVAPWPPTH